MMLFGNVLMEEAYWTIDTFLLYVISQGFAVFSAYTVYYMNKTDGTYAKPDEKEANVR